MDLQASMDMDYLGTWVFYGQVRRARCFTGQWEMTATGERGLGERGMFVLSKVTVESAC